MNTHDARMDAETRRRENARELMRSVGGPTQFAHRVGRKPTQVSHIIGPHPRKKIGPTLARSIERAFGLPLGWLDSERQSPSAPVAISNAVDVQVLGGDACQ